MEESKTHKFKNFVIILLLIIVGFLLWARFISTKGLITKEYAVINSKIPDSFNGFKIVQFSDLHYGRTIQEKELDNIVNKINTLKPELIIFTGDLIDKDIPLTDTKKSIVKKSLSKLDASITKIAILGNHDYKNNTKDLLTDSGFNVLENNYQLIYYKSTTPILLVGLSSSLQDYPDYNKSIDGLTEEELNSYYKVILAHEPDQLKDLGNYNVDLMLAGHSHNGQVRLPFVGAVVKPDGAKMYYDEYYKVNNTSLYVSSGLGTSQINFRFWNKPSINLYRLYNN